MDWLDRHENELMCISAKIVVCDRFEILDTDLLKLDTVAKAVLW